MSNKTTFDQDEILFQLLNGSSALKAAISGGIYVGVRPDNSVLEDVVINSVVVADGSIQLGVANVNIHVADRDVTSGGKTYKAPNVSRLKAITNIVYPLVQEVYGDFYVFFVENQNTIREPEIKQHYVNLRIRFEFHASQYSQ
jgi:hypothetical protein